MMDWVWVSSCFCRNFTVCALNIRLSSTDVHCKNTWATSLIFWLCMWHITNFKGCFQFEPKLEKFLPFVKLTFNPYSAYLVTSHCTPHPQDMHGCERVTVGTRWATSCPDCMDRLTKHYSHLVGNWFLARKTASALSGCMTTESADYCMLINECTQLRWWVFL